MPVVGAVAPGGVQAASRPRSRAVTGNGRMSESESVSYGSNFSLTVCCAMSSSVRPMISRFASASASRTAALPPVAMLTRLQVSMTLSSPGLRP